MLGWLTCACCTDGSGQEVGSLKAKDIDQLRLEGCQPAKVHRGEDLRAPSAVNAAEVEDAKRVSTEQKALTEADAAAGPGSYPASNIAAQAALEGSAGSKNWEVTLERSGYDMKAGLTVDAWRGSKLVIRVVEEIDTMVGEWNRACIASGNTVNRLKTGDVIVSVNDITDDATKMLECISESGKSIIRATRQSELLIKLDTNKNLGLAMSKHSFIVQRINEGAVSDYNKKCEAELQVHRGDQISEVNGEKGDPRYLLNVVASSKDGITFLIKRRPA